MHPPLSENGKRLLRAISYAGGIPVAVPGRMRPTIDALRRRGLARIKGGARDVHGRWLWLILADVGAP